MITEQEKYPELAKALALGEIYLKREDLHPYGSHKGRSIPLMIDKYMGEGKTNFAISSSGNAALAAALHTKEINKKKEQKINLDIFVGNKINQKKLKSIKDLADENIHIFGKERPLQALNQAIEGGKTSLRQSNDDTALIGYKDLAQELASIKDLEAVFIGSSSGTTAQALAQYFLENKIPVAVHIVQTNSCHTLIDGLDSFALNDELSLADAIVDITGLRKQKLIPLIKETGGTGHIASNEEIITAIELVKNHTGIDISPNSALSIVGAMQYSYESKGGPVACIITGQ